MLRGGDAVRLVCEADPTFSGMFRVTKDGWLVLPYLGAVPAGGRTSKEVSEVITGRLQAMAIWPGIRVVATRMPADDLGIGYSGAVRYSGSLPSNKEWRLSDVVQLAVPTENADLGRVRIVDAAGMSEYVSLEPEGGRVRDVLLKPGDAVFFPVSTAPAVVSVLGAVGQPGTVPFKEGMTVKSAVQAAGGLTGNGDAGNVKLERGGKVIDTVNLDLAYDAAVRRGDTIRVSLIARPQHVNVVGAVVRPGAVPWRDGLTLSRALAECGGPSPAARPDVVTLVRRENGKPVRRNFSLARIRSGEGPDPVLLPDDTVEVPPKPRGDV